MKRLTGLDAGFLAIETPTSFMHVAGLLVVDPSEVPGWGFDDVRELYRERLDQAPPFRRRLVEVPFGIHHPVWIEDPDFDLDWHLRHLAVPTPGGRDELTELVAHLLAMPLDRSRPLWETWYIEGLEGGKVALLSKVHHAAIDGAAGEELLVAVLDLSPETEQKPPPERPWVPDKVPSETELVGYAVTSLVQQPVRVANAFRKTVASALQLRERYSRPHVTMPLLPFQAPRTSINGPLTARRSLGLSTLSLERVKSIKNALGCTVNDVVLTICAGALRHHFDANGERFDDPLVAMIPISVRTEDTATGEGNVVTMMFSSLATHEDDPMDRIGAIHASMHEAKAAQKLIGADTLQDWIEFAAPAVAGRAARMYVNTQLVNRHRPLFNVTISNVPGPPFPLYVAGAPVVSCNPIGPIFEGGGLNITVMSYMDRLDFGLQACPDLLPDVQGLADAMALALDELESAVGAHTGEPLGRNGASTPSPAAPPAAAAPRGSSGSEDGPVGRPVGEAASASSPTSASDGTSLGGAAHAAASTPVGRPVGEAAASSSAPARETTQRKRAATKKAAAKTTAGRSPRTTTATTTTAGRKRATTKAAAEKAAAKRTATKAAAKKSAARKVAAKKSATTTPAPKAAATKASSR